MKRKITFLAVCLLLATALLAGCSNGGRDEFYAYLDGKVENSKILWEEYDTLRYSWDKYGVFAYAINQNKHTESEESYQDDRVEYKADDTNVSRLATKRGVQLGTSLDEVLQAYPEFKEAYLEGKSKSELYFRNTEDGKSKEKVLKYDIFWSRYFVHEKEVSEQEFVEYGNTLPENNDFYSNPGAYDCKSWTIMLVMENDQVTEIHLSIEE